jgi:hypothetical protein
VSIANEWTGAPSFATTDNLNWVSVASCLLPIPAGGVKTTACGDVLIARLRCAMMAIIP